MIQCSEAINFEIVFIETVFKSKKAEPKPRRVENVSNYIRRPINGLWSKWRYTCLLPTQSQIYFMLCQDTARWDLGQNYMLQRLFDGSKFKLVNLNNNAYSLQKIKMNKMTFSHMPLVIQKTVICSKISFSYKKLVVVPP